MTTETTEKPRETEPVPADETIQKADEPVPEDGTIQKADETVPDFGGWVEKYRQDSAGISEDGLCNWYLAKLAEADRLLELLDEQYERMKKEIINRKRALQFVQGRQFKARVDEALLAAGGRKKSVNFLMGRAGYRKGRESIDIEDQDACLHWACDNLAPERFDALLGSIKLTAAVKTALETITDDELIEAVGRVNKKPLLEHIKDTGEIPAGCQYRPPVDKFFPEMEPALLGGDDDDE